MNISTFGATGLRSTFVYTWSTNSVMCLLSPAFALSACSCVSFLSERLVDRGRARRRERGDETVAALAWRRVRSDRAEARARQLRLQVRGCDAEVRRALLEENTKDPLEDVVTILLAGRVLERREDRVLLRLRDDTLRDERVEDRLELVRGAGLRPLRVHRRGRALVRKDARAHRRERGHRSAAEEPEAEDAGRRDR